MNPLRAVFERGRLFPAQMLFNRTGDVFFCMTH